MKARTNSGTIVSGVIARILVKNGRAKEIGNSANLASKPKKPKVQSPSISKKAK